MKPKSTSEALLALLTLFLIAVPITSVADGYVLARFWSWFVVNTFNAPALGITTATGLAVFAQFLNRPTKHRDEGEDAFTEIFSMMFSSLWRAGTFFVVGAAVHAFL